MDISAITIYLHMCGSELALLRFWVPEVLGRGPRSQNPRKTQRKCWIPASSLHMCGSQSALLRFGIPEVLDRGPRSQNPIKIQGKCWIPGLEPRILDLGIWELGSQDPSARTQALGAKTEDL